jgi:hypothetical protein
MLNGLEFYDACWCAGTGCGGHLKLGPASGLRQDELESYVAEAMQDPAFRAAYEAAP